MIEKRTDNMRTSKQLKSEILRLDGRSYPAYRDLKGGWDFGEYILWIDHVQSDPFASPSDVSVQIEHPGFPEHLYENKPCRIALQDALQRMFARGLKNLGGKSGSGKSGAIRISRPTQEILERTACAIDPEDGSLRMRFNVGFPARGRSILAHALVKILFDQLPPVIEHNLIYKNMTEEQKDALQKSYELCVDQQIIRQYLSDNNLEAFVANGAILPRMSGASDLPMKDAVPFVSPKENEVIIPTRYHGNVDGMAVPAGITLIVGGGYHGKSTLLEALEKGINNHIAGDGREFVITRDDAVKIRAEDGRCVHEEDISGFIANLPNGKSTKNFSTEDASGSTSQAANVAEALEAGSQLLLMDEDTSATNFMIRDALMSSVVHADQEPIIPFIARIEELSKKGISTILVAGSSGAFFEKADNILQMKEYEPFNITEMAKEKAAAAGLPKLEAYEEIEEAPMRIPLKNPVMDQDKIKVKTTKTDTLTIAREPIDVRAMEQIADEEQLSAIGKMIVYASRNLVDGEKSLEDIADELLALADEKGMSFFGKGNLARPRKAEIMQAFNRWRSQPFKQV